MVGIVGILAVMAVPNLTTMARHYRSIEDARAALSSVTQARALSQRDNMPVQLTFFDDHIELRLAQTTSPVDAVRKLITFPGVATRSVTIGDARITHVELMAGGATVDVTPGAGATMNFCPSSDAYFRVGPAPACTTGNLTSHRAIIHLTSKSETFRILVNPALAAVDLQQG